MFMEACLKNSTTDFVRMINIFVVWTSYVDPAELFRMSSRDKLV